MKLLRSALSFAVIAGAFYLLFVYVGEFRLRQSIVLSLVAAWLAWDLAHAAPKPSGIFTPYYVTVWPKWFQLLTDLRLISTPEDWESIQNSLKELPSTEYRVLRSGIYFTVVQQTEDLQRTLIYRNDHRTFVTAVDFEEYMDPVEVERRIRISPLIRSNVMFFMRYDVGGYSFGIRVPRSWWEKTKSGCSAPVREQEHDRLTDQVKLVLATLPYPELSIYWESPEWDTQALKEFKLRQEPALSKFGWKRDEHADSIEHAYFTVRHDSI